MNKMPIILDTNVLFAGLYSSQGASFQVLDKIDLEEIRPVLSTTLLFEYEDVLRRNRAKLLLADAQIDAVLDNLCFLSDHQTIHFLWRPYLKDPKDDHVLEVAVASATPLIVTHNLRDFRGCGAFGIEAITPKELLERML